MANNLSFFERADMFDKSMLEARLPLLQSVVPGLFDMGKSREQMIEILGITEEEFDAVYPPEPVEPYPDSFTKGILQSLL